MIQIHHVIDQSTHPTLSAAISLMQRHWQAKFPHCRDDLALTLHLDPQHPGIASEGFELRSTRPSLETPAAVTLCIRDARGLLGGFGHLLHTTGEAGGRLQLAALPVRQSPAKPIRGIYFATHFFNYYQTAPLAELATYLEELALWGMNTLFMWYDMHHFAGFNDPRAAQLRERLDLLLGKARQLGLDTGLMVIGNEAYADSPPPLRADASAARGGFYDCDVCPAIPGSLDYLDGIFSEFFDWLRPYRPTWLCFWPNDQGGCGCANCRPWGGEGFLTCLRHLRPLAVRKLPGCKFMLSTWFMDSTEWSRINEQLADPSLRPDAVMMEQFRGMEVARPLADAHALSLPVAGFPEISMRDMFPWGGFGANPQPRHFHGEWQQHHARFAGGLPYSEGIFDDLNKSLWLQQYVDPARHLDDMLDAYLGDLMGLPAGHALVAAARRVVHTLEDNHHFRYWPGKLDGIKLMLNWFPSRDAPRREDRGAQEAMESMQEIDSRLPAHIRSRWRWRLLMIRALLDAQLKQHTTPTADCIEAFKELDRLYHVTADTDAVVRSPRPR